MTTALAEIGANVVAVGRNGEHAEVAAELTGNGHEVHAYRADVADASAVNDVVEHVESFRSALCRSSPTKTGTAPSRATPPGFSTCPARCPST
ncbi:SDR family NAD(P)-dependent oxidoreductase [Saccharopolyspora sp. NPDC000995]